VTRVLAVLVNFTRRPIEIGSLGTWGAQVFSQTEIKFFRSFFFLNRHFRFYTYVFSFNPAVHEILKSAGIFADAKFIFRIKNNTMRGP